MRRVTHRPKPDKSLEQYGRDLLLEASDIWTRAERCDTAVREQIAEGLGHLVRSAYDCIASASPIADPTAWIAHIEASTAEWFRERGFAEWFCIAASLGFNTSRPRILSELGFRRRKIQTAGPRSKRRAA